MDPSLGGDKKDGPVDKEQVVVKEKDGVVVTTETTKTNIRAQIPGNPNTNMLNNIVNQIKKANPALMTKPIPAEGVSDAEKNSEEKKKKEAEEKERKEEAVKKKADADAKAKDRQAQEKAENQRRQEREEEKKQGKEERGFMLKSMEEMLAKQAEDSNKKLEEVKEETKTQAMNAAKAAA